jgi:hypothetical protein
MLEMAKDHFQFVPDILSISNQRALGLESRDSQIRCERYIRSLKSYSPLTHLEADEESGKQEAG